MELQRRAAKSPAGDRDRSYECSYESNSAFPRLDEHLKSGIDAAQLLQTSHFKISLLHTEVFDLKTSVERNQSTETRIKH